MKSQLCMLLTMLLITVKIDRSISLNCFTCNPCPSPFIPSSYLITNRTGCGWCAKVEVRGMPTPIRDCVQTCNADTWSARYRQYTYACCSRNFCNKSQTNYPTHQMLLTILFGVCFYINKTSSKN
ncbi:unnamed protein product [Heterobilharzia americana]|nr:unnamed protein product [Heterobilharzia americana]CAH8465952.1 unnamed protein product [Heterobilharzia americana]